MWVKVFGPETEAEENFIIRSFLQERDQYQDLGLDGRIILKLIFKEYDRISWIRSQLLQDRNKWRTVVNAVMNLRVS